MNKTYTVTQFAEFIGKSTATIYQWIKSEDLNQLVNNTVDKGNLNYQLVEEDGKKLIRVSSNQEEVSPPELNLTGETETMADPHALKIDAELKKVSKELENSFGSKKRKFQAKENYLEGQVFLEKIKTALVAGGFDAADVYDLINNASDAMKATDAVAELKKEMEKAGLCGCVDRELTVHDREFEWSASHGGASARLTNKLRDVLLKADFEFRCTSYAAGMNIITELFSHPDLEWTKGPIVRRRTKAVNGSGE